MNEMINENNNNNELNNNRINFKKILKFIIFFKEITTYFQQRRIKLIKTYYKESKEIQF